VQIELHKRGLLITQQDVRIKWGSTTQRALPDSSVHKWVLAQFIQIGCYGQVRHNLQGGTGLIGGPVLKLNLSPIVSCLMSTKDRRLKI